jgi:anti-sigma B factor antagonist
MTLGNQVYGDTMVLIPAEPRIDHANSEDFKLALQPYLDDCKAGGRQLVVDFSQIEYISSVGLRVLMLAARQAKAQNGAIVVASLQPVVKEIFDISRFNLVIECFPSLRDALTRISPAALAVFDGA